MKLELKNKIIDALKLEYSSLLVNSGEFYFQKAKDALDYFMQLEVTEETRNFLLENRKEYNELKLLFEDRGELSIFGKAILTVISYCDSKALKKNELNQYDDKRVLALAFVRMNNWIEQLITYKFEGRLETGSIKNAVEYLLSPENNFTMLSENHRSQLSEKLFNKIYNKGTFKNDFINFFSEFSIDVLNYQNYTHLLTRVIYNISSEWKDSIVGIMASDSTGWLSNFQMKDSYDVFWNSKKPSGTTDTIRLLKECIIENGHFKLFYTSFYNVLYIAEVIDIVENEKEYIKADWQQTFIKESPYPKFVDLQDDNKTAKIIFLINKFYQVDPIPIDQFKMFKSYLYPRQDNLTPIENYITNSQNIENVKSKKMNQLLLYKKQIILQGPPGTGKTREAKLIAQKILKENKIINKTVLIKTLTKDYIKSHLFIGQKITGKNNKEFEILDLDKNVVLLKSETSKPWKPSYNKIIDSFNNKLWEIKGRTGGYKSYEDAIAMHFYENHLSSIHEIEESINEEKDFLYTLQFHPSYTYEDFVRGIVTKTNEEGEITYEGENKILGKFAENALNDSENNYVLIIDEINRANLSSVLGELIYALEYRGEEVESMYEVDGSQKLILPPNLYIIGTMNTADRSVGHIDYAIRRRFAFVDVLPHELNDNKIVFHRELFRKVSKLFIENYDDYISNEKVILKQAKTLSGEFRPEDVWLGHSYFIQKKLSEDVLEPQDFTIRIDYEIKPILLEYVKDGILIGNVDEVSIEDYIKAL